jgi:2-(1,2-epoxy-1,2-dihydrophenyl)acetyl-CoA isomerase
MPDHVLLAVAEGVATLVLNRPERLNAFGEDMREQLIDALDRVAALDDVGVLVVTGAGRAFCAGGDVHHMVRLKDAGAGFEALRPLLDRGRDVVGRLAALRFPVVAAVNGPAAGAGLNLALACDVRVASDRATFGETFVRIGLHPDWGGTFHLPRRTSLAQALLLCWTGDVIDASEALRLGLVERVVPHDAFDLEVKALARRLAAAPRTSVRHAKLALRAAEARSLAECLEAEAAAQEACWASGDTAEGLHAFVEKRPPAFGAPPLEPGAAPSRGARLFE